MYDNEKLLSMSLDELDLLIGESLMEGELGMKPASNAEKRQASQRWFDINFKRLSRAICSNKTVKNYLLGKDNATRNELFAAVIDTLLKLSGLGAIPVAVLSARLVNFGLHKLCSSTKKEAKP